MFNRTIVAETEEVVNREEITGEVVNREEITGEVVNREEITVESFYEPSADLVSLLEQAVQEAFEIDREKLPIVDGYEDATARAQALYEGEGGDRLGEIQEVPARLGQQIREEIYHHFSFLSEALYDPNEPLSIQENVALDMALFLGISADADVVLQLVKDFAKWLCTRGEVVADWGTLRYCSGDRFYITPVGGPDIEIEPDETYTFEDYFPPLSVTAKK